MASDQISLFLYPPRWKRHSVAHNLMKHASGEAVRVVSAVREAATKGPAVRFEDVCRWFEGKGFEIANRDVRYGYFRSVPNEADVGSRPEIEVGTSTEGDEVTSLYCRFLLTREAPLCVERWEAFMQELCETFLLRISISDTESVGPDRFLSVLRQHGSWHWFAERFGWSKRDE